MNKNSGCFKLEYQRNMLLAKPLGQSIISAIPYLLNAYITFGSCAWYIIDWAVTLIYTEFFYGNKCPCI